MAAPSSVAVLAIAATAAACIGWVWIYLLIKRHLQSRHPAIFNGFRYPRTAADDEEAEVRATFALGAWLRSGDWRRLDDPYLTGLMRARRINVWICGVTIAVAAAALVGGW